jgi:hypothetical protein
MTEAVPCSWVFWIRLCVGFICASRLVSTLTNASSKCSTLARCSINSPASSWNWNQISRNKPFALESDTATGNVIRVPALKSHIPISGGSPNKGGNE